MGWQTLWSGSLGANSTGWANWTIVNRFEAAALADISGATKIRVRLVASTAANASIASVYFGHPAASGDVYDFDGAQVAGPTSFTVSAGSPHTTAPAAFAYDSSKALLVAISFGATSSAIRQGANTNVDRHQRNLSDDAGTTDKSSYSSSSNTGLVDLIEVYVPDVLDAAAGSYSVSGQDAATGVVGIAANAGGYALTGEAAGLALGAKLHAEAGVYSLTGEAADIWRGFPLAAETGSYVVPGQAAAFLAIRAVYPDPGAYTITGQGAALSVSMPAGAGAYTVTGDAAIAVATRLMAASAGAYAVSGAAAVTEKGFNLTSAAGAISVSGQDAILREAHKLPADRGLYSVTGEAAEWKRNDWNILWEDDLGSNGSSGHSNQTGVVSFSPSILNDVVGGTKIRFKFAAPSEGPTSLSKAYVGHAPLSGDAYDFDGTPAQITHSGGTTTFSISTNGEIVTDDIDFSYDPALTLNVAWHSDNTNLHSEPLTGVVFHSQAGDSAATANKTGSWSSTSNQAKVVEKIEVFVQTGPVLAAEAGAISVTGVAADTKTARTMPAAAGAIGVTGTSAALRRSYPALAAETGSFAVTGQGAGLNKGFTVAAGAGTHAVAGQSATPRAQRQIYPAQGAYEIVGLSAALSVSMPADRGIYMLSGVAADLFFRRQATALTGAYALTGNAAAIVRGRHLFPETGQYATAGVLAVLAGRRKRRTFHEFTY